MCVAGWDAAGAAVGAGLRRGAHQVRRDVSLALYAEETGPKAGKRPCLFPAPLWRNLLVMTAMLIRRLLVLVDTRWIVDSPLALA